jgi:hypothetical protein
VYEKRINGFSLAQLKFMHTSLLSFFNWLLTFIKVHYIKIRRSFQYGIESLLIYVFYIHKKKIIFFQCRIQIPFSLHTSI